jgi:ferredoxin-NADP reductase
MMKTTRSSTLLLLAVFLVAATPGTLAFSNHRHRRVAFAGVATTTNRAKYHAPYDTTTTAADYHDNHGYPLYQQQQQQEQQRRHGRQGCRATVRLDMAAQSEPTAAAAPKSWGPEPVWSDATVTQAVPACASHKSILLTVSVPAETAAAYTTPGQYVQVCRRVEDEQQPTPTNKPLFLAICSPPNPENATFEFLVKRTTDNEWLLLQSPSTTQPPVVHLHMSQVLGRGYQMAEYLDSVTTYDFPTQNVLLFAAGSGIAPIRAAILSGQLAPTTSTTRTIRLYYGERTEDDLCFTTTSNTNAATNNDDDDDDNNGSLLLFADWERMGIQVVPVVSQPKQQEQQHYRTGYVQTALEEDGIPVPRNSGALLCGMKGMTQATKELLVKAGVFEGRILFNF